MLTILICSNSLHTLRRKRVGHSACRCPFFFRVFMRRALFFRFLPSALLVVLVFLLTLPVLAVVLSWLEFDSEARSILSQMLQTVLPDYTWTSLLLCLLVGVGVATIGMATASAVTLFEFPGRRVFEWALLLPLAMPAYVLAYAYIDFL